jgi:lipopolysaccharide transport system ATP-binding protein
MSCNSPSDSCSIEPVIYVRNLSKCYQLYDKPQDRLKQFFWRDKRRYFREFWALRDVNFEVMPGEVVGIIGRNGAGKSTLLQLVCGTLTPTHGEIRVNGRVAALLELGAGFNPDFTGRENVFMSAAVMGLTEAEIGTRFDDIIEFSGIRDFIDQPVKTYSSGMYVRLAFSVAISVDPDILVIDEALSVGDGAFARKSFDRIMALKKAGKTILFCSHSMYHIEALCQRALWLDGGVLRMFDVAQQVTNAYNTALALESDALPSVSANLAVGDFPAAAPLAADSSGRIVQVLGACDGAVGTRLAAKSQLSTLSVTVDFVIDPALPRPSVALGIDNAAGISVSSVISTRSAQAVAVDREGKGRATVVFPDIPLLKGEYHVTAFLACEQGLHVYDYAPRCLTLEVAQEGVLQGVVVLPHLWREAT